jgi:hypothetical protein
MTQPSSEFLQLQAALAGEYSLQREIGRGGMSIVFLARDVQLDRDVAIKVLPADLARTIVAPFPPPEAARVLREVAWALAYAHGRGIVHRDVKPDNILLEAGSGRALVTDFGIAHVDCYDRPVTDPGKIMGTAHFMSPERAANERFDGRSDLYSLGVVGYLATSGRLPFEAASLPALLVRQATEDPPGVLRAAPRLPTSLAAVIDRCLSRDPAGRFPDGEAMAAALAPAPEARPALPPTLRAWLAARNPLLVPYMGWSAGFAVLTGGNVFANLTHNPGSSFRDVVVVAALTSLPIFPLVGFHLNQARRQFRVGHTLADLRSALRLSRRERAAADAHELEGEDAPVHRALRLGTVASATWLATTLGLVVQGTLHENRNSISWFLGPVLTTMLLGAVSNALDVQFIPHGIRQWWQTGIRDRLWSGRAGDWLAARFGAPERSRAVGAGVFRPTEAVLGVEAAELFAALPKAYGEQLAALPAIAEAPNVEPPRRGRRSTRSRRSPLLGPPMPISW